MTITLESIKAEHSKISDMIAAFEKQAATSEIRIAATTITLAPGEHYAGLILAEDGTPSHHLILLPGDVDAKGWAAAKDWATDQGGELPTRREQSLLFANLKSQFEERWYWSAEGYEPNTAYAWCQNFSNGYQNCLRKGYDFCRARAVRRLVIQ